MRRTVHLLLLVALAAAAPVAEDVDQKNILQMLLTADPHENDIIDNNIIEKNKIIEYEMGSSREDGEELTPTTEYSLDSEIESYTEPIQELENESIDKEDYATDIASDSEIEIETGSAEEVADSVPELPLNNGTSKDSNIKTEQQVEPNISTEIEEVIQIREEYEPFIIRSPQYAINFPQVVPELESTNLEESSIEEEIESNIKDEQYSNQEWPQRYAPGIPNYYDINAMEPEPQLHNSQEWPQRYAPGFPETQEYEQPIDNIPGNPEMSGNIFGNQEYPIEWVSELHDSVIVEPIGPAHSEWDVHGPGQFVEDGPIVDTFPDVYPDPGTFSNYPEVNQFGGDGLAHAVMEDITIEPIFFDQVPLLYDNTPDSSIDEELPEEILEISDIMYESNANPKEALELIVVDEEIIDIPQTPIAGEVEQPQDSPIIATAILQDTRPEVDMLGLFDGPEDIIIPERIEETSYTLEDNDFVEENIPASEDSPYQIFDQDVTAIDNDSFPNSNSPGFDEEDDFILDTFGLPSLIIDLEQAAFPDKPIVNEPSVIPIGNGQFYPMEENEQRIYFQDEIPEFPSEPDFMAPHSHDDFMGPHSHDDFMGPHSQDDFMGPHSHDDFMAPHSQDEFVVPHSYDEFIAPHSHDEFVAPHSHDEFVAPHSHDEFSYGHNSQPYSHNENINYNDVPHTHQGDQYILNNFPQNSYFEDDRGTIKRDGAHIVPDVAMDVDVIDLPIMETGEMGIFSSPMMGSRNPASNPQITVIIASKPEQIKDIWSRFIRPMQQKPYSPVDMIPSQNNVPQFDNIEQYSQNQNNNQYSQNFHRQNFNQYPLQNYNMNDMDMNMNFPPNQLFNSGMSPFTPSSNQQANMGSMFPNLNMNLPSFEDLPEYLNEEINREIGQMFSSQPEIGQMFSSQPEIGQMFSSQPEIGQMFSSQPPMSSYGPPMFPISANQQTWPSRYAQSYPEYNYGNNGPFYPQRNMNNQFYIP